MSYIVEQEDSDYFFLEVKKSLIEGAGDGVFLRKDAIDLPANYILCEYRGRIIRNDNINNILDIDNKYLISISQKYHIDANNSKCVASMINDCIDFKKSFKMYKKAIKNKKLKNIHEYPLIAGKKYNTNFTLIHNKMFVLSTDNIKQGDELYCGYGVNYWNHIFYKKLNIENK